MAQYKKVGNLKVRTDLSPEKQALVNEIAKNYVQQNKKIDAERIGNIARGGLGAAVSGASFFPILNIPGAGAAIGGAMYDLGQGIVEGDKALDLAKRASRGAAIGAVIPPAAKKLAATKAGQAVGKQLTKVAEKAAENPTVQKAYDALMTDIKAFNPNKQTVYHGSPYDFNKFSNEAIGTGEGAQAHGMGHYAALNKKVAEGYRQRLGGYEYDGKPVLNNSEEDILINKIINDGYNNTLSKYQKDLNDMNEIAKRWEHSPNDYNAVKELANEIENKINIIKNIDTNKISSSSGQLYKLSVPKDDVMLREDLPFGEQSKTVQDALEQYMRDEYKGQKPFVLNDALKVYEDLLGVKTGKDFYKHISKGELSKYNKNPEAYPYKLKNIYQNEKEAFELGANKLNNLGIKGISYNGGIDDEARVIFNPDDIDIVRKYYNQPTLKDIYNKFINSGAIAGAITNPKN